MFANWLAYIFVSPIWSTDCLNLSLRKVFQNYICKPHYDDVSFCILMYVCLPSCLEQQTSTTNYLH